MNKGNYSAIMNQTTRVHTTPKRILRFDSDTLYNKDLNIDANVRVFFEFLDQFERPEQVKLTDGQWNLLFATLRKIGDKSGINYCIYYSRCSLLYDITQRSIIKDGDPPDSSVIWESERQPEVATPRKQCSSDSTDITDQVPNAIHVQESALGVIKRLNEELRQIDLKIAHLQERKAEVTAKRQQVIESL